VQIVHGMSEYILRYDAFARYLSQNGILAIGFDNASHGQSWEEGAPRGYFGAQHGWDSLITDLRVVQESTQAEYPSLPYILFGHSMGSFLARSYAARHGEGIDAFIFMGTAGPNPAQKLAERMARQQINALGPSGVSHTLNKIAFGAYNRGFRPQRTAFDWLSREPGSVDAYVADAACGFPFTAAGYRDLFEGLGEISKKKWAGQVPHKPILMLSGMMDPVAGKDARGVKLVADRLVKSGHEVELLLYAGARHELLNETNRDEVMADILSFIERQV
jgi:alpha-beta hydrolase superfamily lysophospholipase